MCSKYFAEKRFPFSFQVLFVRVVSSLYHFKMCICVTSSNPTPPQKAFITSAWHDLFPALLIPFRVFSFFYTLSPPECPLKIEFVYKSIRYFCLYFVHFILFKSQALKSILYWSSHYKGKTCFYYTSPEGYSYTC